MSASPQKSPENPAEQPQSPTEKHFNNNQEPDFIPPYPRPHKTKGSLFKHFIRSRNSWIHALFERSYAMKMGHVKLPAMEFFMVNEPSLVQKIMVDEAEDFPKHTVMHDVLKPALGESIFTTNGETWKRQREMIDTAFVHTRLRRVFPLMSAATEEMIDRLSDISADGSSVLIDSEMTHVTADVIFRTILSHPLSASDAETLFHKFNTFQALAQKRFVFFMAKLPDFILKHRANLAARGIRNILAPVIKKRFDAYIETGEDLHEDILSALMTARDEHGNAFAYEELVDHVSMLFLAGHETSAAALTWSLYLLAACPHIQDCVREEINAVTDSQPLSYDHMRKLKHTMSVFSEALRLYPPVGFLPRQSRKAQCMRDKNVKAGAMIVIAPWLIHRHEDRWQDPHSFKPERFSAPQTSDKESIKCAYIPFGKGPRICIGKGFAIQEATLVLASIVRNFRIFLPPDTSAPEPVGRVTIRPKNGVFLRLENLIS